MSSNSASDEQTLLPSPTLKEHSEDGAARAGGQYVTPGRSGGLLHAAAAGRASAVTGCIIIIIDESIDDS